MTPPISPRSANGSIKHLKPRAPASGPSQPRNPPRKTKGSIVPEKNSGAPRPSHSFAKITTLVFLIAVADVLFVWHSINASIGGEGEEPHHVGAEAGLHHLHENRRMKKVNDHIISEMVKQEGSKTQALTNRNHDRSITMDTGGAIIGKDTNKTSATNKKVEKESSHQIDERIAKILKAANVEVDKEIASQMPTWDNVVLQYGEKPIIYGLETCEPYRQSVKPEDRMVGPVGIFNTGTNLLFQLMKENCNIQEARLSKTHREPNRNGVRFQAPWGKHNPPSTHRMINVAAFWGEGINHTAFFPVVMIKDPYHWMGSECRHPYQTWWKHSKPGFGNNCPNLIEKEIVQRDVPVAARVRYALGMVEYESLISVWNKWYEEYEEETYPMLRTRFEDLLFHGEEVTEIACHCVGGVFNKNGFKYVEGSAKENGLPIHNGANGLVKSLVQYGNPHNRLNGLTDRDRWYASKTLNLDLMKKFGYTAPPLPT